MLHWMIDKQAGMKNPYCMLVITNEARNYPLLTPGSQKSGRSGAKCAGEESSWPTQLASYNPPMLLAQGKVQVDTVRPLYVPARDHQVV